MSRHAGINRKAFIDCRELFYAPVTWKFWNDCKHCRAEANHVGQSPQVEVKKPAIGEFPSTLSVPPISVNIYRFPAVRTAE